MSPAGMRRALLLQLGHLEEELEATRVVGRHLLPAMLTARSGDASVQECYGQLAERDRKMLPQLKHMTALPHPAVSSPIAPAEASWNEMTFGEVLDAACAARRTLVAFVRTLPLAAWTRTEVVDGKKSDMFGLLHQLTQADAELLQRVARQLNQML